jgi:predicted glycosyltransferase
MHRILVYSHDTYGLGNIRRMLAIAADLAGSLEDASVLVLSGSPMLQGFRIPPQVDYIKLPSITRTAREGYATRSLRLGVDDVMDLRANLALAAVADFRPDVMLVDKKPYGVRNELEGAILYAKTQLPETALVLVLRDILDEPKATMRTWRLDGYTAAIDRFFDRVLVLGTPGIFDMRREYALPDSVCDKLRFCGYIRRPHGTRERAQLRRELGLDEGGRLVLVTPGGGQDGDRIVQTYADALPAIHTSPNVRSVIVTGPEMAVAHRESVERAARGVGGATVLEFTDDMMSWMDAADLVVCMAGYNTLCEVATLRKRAIVVPRVHPVEEQAIRAERLARAGVVHVVHPEALEADHLVALIRARLDADTASPPQALDLTALPRVTRNVRALLRQRRSAAQTTLPVARSRVAINGSSTPHWIA